MKTLQEVLDRNDYVRLTASLKSKTIELAEKIRHKMEALDLEDFYGYKIVRANANGYSNVYLAYSNGYEYFSLEDERSYYLCGNFNCRIQAATNDMRLNFINVARDMLADLDKKETAKCEAVEIALAKVKDI